MNALPKQDASFVGASTPTSSRIASSPSVNVRGSIAKATAAIGGLGFLVDTKYTDAFGLNVTCSPNGWLIKV